MSKLYHHAFFFWHSDSRSDPVGQFMGVSNELPASQEVHNLRLEAAPPYYRDSQLQGKVQWK